MMYPFAALRRRVRPCRRCGGPLVVGDKVYHWWCERCEVRKFSDSYRLTYLYAFRRLGKAVRNLGRELERTRLGRFLSTIVEVLSSRVEVKRSEFPFRCDMCHTMIESADDRMEWHGIGNCVDICLDCFGSGEVESNGGQSFPALCKPCGGRGWFNFDPEPLRFPDKPIIPTKDAKFDA